MLLNSPSKIISSSCGEKNANVVLIMKIHLLHLKYHGKGVLKLKAFLQFFAVFEDVLFFPFQANFDDL